MSEVLTPIFNKLKYWKIFDENYPSKGNLKEQNIYRQNNDLDCTLNNRNLQADTIFSLWTPLKYTIQMLNHKEWTKRSFYTYIFSSNAKQEQLNKLEEYLPPDNELVKALSNLFKIGIKKCNTMILPTFLIEEPNDNYWKGKPYSLNIVRGKNPYNDYMPYFLYNCLTLTPFVWIGNKSNIKFSGRAFNTDNEAKDWIENQKLNVFFLKPNEISYNSIIDISGNGNVTKEVPENKEALKKIINTEITILKNRENIMSKNKNIILINF